jgi:hypothetical protein
MHEILAQERQEIVAVYDTFLIWPFALGHRLYSLLKTSLHVW